MIERALPRPPGMGSTPSTLAASLGMHRRMRRLLAVCMTLASWLYGVTAHAASALLFYDKGAAPVAFAVGELDAALRARGYEPEHRSLQQFFQARAPAQAAASLRIS